MVTFPAWRVVSQTIRTDMVAMVLLCGLSSALVRDMTTQPGRAPFRQPIRNDKTTRQREIEQAEEIEQSVSRQFEEDDQPRIRDYTGFVVPKTQSMMKNCWYTCIQMLLTYACMNGSGRTIKPWQAREGHTMTLYRANRGGNLLLDEDLKRENHLQSAAVFGYNMDSYIRLLEHHGPLILSGENMFGFEHNVVLMGVVEEDERPMKIWDVAWLKKINIGGSKAISWARFERSSWNQRPPVYVDGPIPGPDGASVIPAWCDHAHHQKLE